jgi:hypothetical protein
MVKQPNSPLRLAAVAVQERKEEKRKVTGASARDRLLQVGRGRPSFDHRGCRLGQDQHPCPSRRSSHRRWRRSASYHAADLLAARCRQK